MPKSAADFFFDNAGKFELLEHDQICELARIVQKWQADPQGCSTVTALRGKAARDKMVRHNLRLIIHVWRKSYSARLTPTHPGLVDAFQCAAIDLTRAAEKYVPSKSKFSTYAAVWIHKGLKGYLSKEDRMVRIPDNNFYLVKPIQAMIVRARLEGRPMPTWEEIAAELSKTRRNVPSPETLKTLVHAFGITEVASLDMKVGSAESDTSLVEMLADPNCAADDDAEAVSRAVKFLSDQEREVISSRYYSANPQMFKDLGARLGVSESQAQLIERKAIDSIRNLARVN